MGNQQKIKSPKSKFNRYLDKGINAGASDRYNIARKWYLKAAELGTTKERAFCWFYIAHCYNNQDQRSEALRFARRAERFAPNSSKIQRFIGHIQLGLGRPKLAERALRKSIKKKPTASAYIFLGSSLGKQGRLPEVKTSFQAAIRLEPNNEEAHYLLGSLYRLGKQYKKAEKHLHRAIEIDPKYALAYAELGSLLLDNREGHPARTVLKKSVKLDPNYYWSRLHLAITNWHLRRLKEAEEQYRAALKIAPSDALATAFLGDFLSCEQKTNAAYYLKKAVAIDPGNDVALYSMGKYYYRNYRDKEALFYLKKAARKGHKEAKKLLPKLSQ